MRCATAMCINLQLEIVPSAIHSSLLTKISQEFKETSESESEPEPEYMSYLLFQRLAGCCVCPVPGFIWRGRSISLLF